MLVRLAGHNAVGVPNRLQPIWQGEFEYSEAAEYHAVQQVYGLSHILNGRRRRREEIAGTVKAIVHCVCKAVKAALRFRSGWRLMIAQEKDSEAADLPLRSPFHESIDNPAEPVASGAFRNRSVARDRQSVCLKRTHVSVNFSLSSLHFRSSSACSGHPYRSCRHTQECCSRSRQLCRCNRNQSIERAACPIAFLS